MLAGPGVAGRVALLVAGCLIVAACTGQRGSADGARRHRAARPLPAAGALLASPGRLVDQPVASTGCGRLPMVRPGTTAQLSVAVPPASAAGARTRRFWLHVPARYAPRHPAPLVLAFHGAGGTGPGMERTSGLSALADQRGFLVAYPQALAQPRGGQVGWDSSGPHDPFADHIDDGLFTSDILNVLQAGYCVDPARIAVAGFSNGGGMTGYLACVLAGRISAFAAVEGEFFQIPGGCRPSRPASILDVHAVTDPVAPYAGVPARGSPDYYALAVPAWLAGWARRDGCRGAPRIFLNAPGLAGQAWPGCPGNVAVAGYRLSAGGHTWPRALGAAAGSQAIIAFFAAHPLRSLTARPRSADAVPALAARPAVIGSLRQFRLPTPGAGPFDIAAGPGGTVWFTEFDADQIGRISPAGVVSEYRVPTPDAGPYQITAGPDGAMWFTEYNTTKVGRISPDGQVTELPLPRPSFGGAGITGRPGGPVWTADPAGYVDEITAGGKISRTRVPAGSGLPFAIAATGDGSIWITELTGYFEHSGVLIRVPAGGDGPAPAPALTLASHAANVDALAAGPARTLWFTDFGASQIGELGPAGRLRLFADPSPYSGLSDITMGPDGAMWFTEQAGLVGRVTPGGLITQLALPSPGSNPDGITAGPGRTIWIAETGVDAIARIVLQPAASAG